MNESPSAAGRASELLEEWLPQFMFDVRFLDLLLWQWAGLVLLAALAYVAAWLGSRIVFGVLRRVVARTATVLDDRILALAGAPFRLALTVALFEAGTVHLSLPGRPLTVLAGLEKGLLVLAGTWLASRLVDLATEMARQKLEESRRTAAVAALPLGTRAAKIFLAAMALVVLLQNLGFNVTGLIAGLGVGGLAVALASQKSLANLFGGVSLVADQPVRVGDFCRFSDGKVGTVEEIGIRSTRIRTLDRTLITVPNAEFSEIQIENFAVRDRMRIYAILNLRYETSPDQMRQVLAAIRKILLSHPRVTDDPARARFVAFGAHSLDVEIFAYADTGDYNEFLMIREDIFLRIMDAVAASGTGFAFPSQTLYLGRDAGLDPEASRRAEEEIAEARKRSQLPFPDYPPETKAGFRGTLDYPPEGSAVPGHGRPAEEHDEEK